MEGKNYTVIELAEQIGVPRTTINDWLSRYSQYIETAVQGKRKVYPESALAVLREIALMRNAGKAFADIEAELYAKHPIRAVPVQEEPAANPDRTKTPEEAAVFEKGPAGGNAGFAVIARQQSEEIGRLIGESFRNMNERILDLEKLSAAQRKVSLLWLAVFLLFLLFLTGGGYFAWTHIESGKKENRMLRQQQAESASRLAELKEQSVTLIAGSKTFQANIMRLESELKRQKRDFEQSIKSETSRLTELYSAKEKALLSERDQALLKIREQETRLSLEKERFAAERLKLLKEMEELKREREEWKKKAGQHPVSVPSKPRTAVKKKPDGSSGDGKQQALPAAPAASSKPEK